jgi:peptide-methionine (R)-S-oxide reductase
MKPTLLARMLSSLAALAGLTVLAGAACDQTSRGAASQELNAQGKPYEVSLPPAEWRKKLSAVQFHVLREQGTERAFTGKYWDNKKAGDYHCAGCNQRLYSSKDKFKSGTGWPSFTRAVEDKAIERHSDMTFGMVRTELRCSRCGGHLGHVFDDGPKPTGERHCINSVSLVFVAEKHDGDAKAPAKG